MEPVAKVSSKHRPRLLIALSLTTALLGGGLALGATPALAEGTSYDDALNQLNRLSDEYGVLADEQDRTFAELQDVRSKIAETETQIKGVQKEVRACQAELREKKDVLASQVSADYKQGTVSLLSIILSSSSFEDAISKMYYHGSVYQAEAAKIDDVNTAQQKLQERKSELEKLKSEYDKQEADVEELYAQKSAQAEEMQAQQAEAAALLQSLSKEEQEQLGDEGSDLLAEAKLVVEAEEEESAEDASDEPADTTDESTEQAEDTSDTQAEDKQDAEETKTEQTATTKKETSTKTKEKKKQEQTQQQEEAPAQEQQQEEPKKKRKESSSAGTAQILLDAAYSTSGSEALNNGWGCAGWIYTVFRNSGLYNKKPSCAAWYYNNWCYSSDRSELQPGMVIAVSTWTGTAAGKIYGHVGLYVGNNTVRHLSAGAVREMSVDKWIRQYGTTVTPRWGWNGGIVLS